jgi:hypothetical protein
LKRREISRLYKGFRITPNHFHTWIQQRPFIYTYSLFEALSESASAIASGGVAIALINADFDF